MIKANDVIGREDRMWKSTKGKTESLNRGMRMEWVRLC